MFSLLVAVAAGTPLVVSSLENYSWTKRVDNGTAKIYSKNILEIYVNGQRVRRVAYANN